MRSSAVILFLTGMALVACVALAVGVTVQLVDIPRPGVTADLSAMTRSTAVEDVSDAGSGGTDAVGNLALVGSAAASNLANSEAAKLAAKRVARAEQASRSKQRKRLAAATPAPAPQPEQPDQWGQPDQSGQPFPDGPHGPPDYQHEHWHPDR